MGFFDLIPVQNHDMSVWSLIFGMSIIFGLAFACKVFIKLYTIQNEKTTKNTDDIQELIRCQLKTDMTLDRVDKTTTTMLKSAQELNTLVIKHLIKNNNEMD